MHNPSEIHDCRMRIGDGDVAREACTVYSMGDPLGAYVSACRLSRFKLFHVGPIENRNNGGMNTTYRGDRGVRNSNDFRQSRDVCACVKEPNRSSNAGWATLMYRGWWWSRIQEPEWIFSGPLAAMLGLGPVWPEARLPSRALVYKTRTRDGKISEGRTTVNTCP